MFGMFGECSGNVRGQSIIALSAATHGQPTSLGHLTALGQRARFQVLPSVGTFGYEPQPRTLFGLVRGIEAHGLYMNARASVQIASHDGDPEARRALNLQTGLLGSALEHAIPEQMFTDPEAADAPEAVSAVKALGMALQQGQRLYQLTPENIAETLPRLNLDSQAMGEITRALQTGQQVIAHTDPVEVPGWRGAGYILLDPLTGDGAYKISGGKNGGFIFEVIGALVWAVVEVFEFASKALLRIKEYIEKVIDFIRLIQNCSSVSAVIAIVALSLMVGKLSVIAVAYIKISKLIGVSFIAFGNLLSGSFLFGWANNCYRES